MAGAVILTDGANGPDRSSAYGWLVFALSFGLLISDYMARQVLNAVFPLLAEICESCNWRSNIAHWITTNSSKRF